MIKACIFDLGGTLVDRFSLTSILSLKDAFSTKNIYITNSLIFKNLGKHKREHIQNIINDEGISHIWRRIYGNFPSENESLDLYNIYNEIKKVRCSSLMDILPETKGIIKYLNDNNIKVGCTTDLDFKSMLLVTEKLNNKGILLDSYVDSSSMDYTSTIDHSMVYENMKKLNINNSRKVIKIDDTAAGIKEGIRAGCWTVGVSKWSINMEISTIEDAYNLHDEELYKKLLISKDILLNSGADYVINTLDELPWVIDDINSKNSIYLIDEKRWI